MFSIQNIDKIVRVISISTLVPYTYLALLLSAFATDNPDSGMGGFFLILVLMSIPFILITISTLRPAKISKNVYIGSLFAYISTIGTPILFYAMFMNLSHMIGYYIYIVLLFTFGISYFLVFKFFKLHK